MDRKEFLSTCSMVCLGSVVLPLLATGCASTTHYAAFTISNNLLIVSLAEFIDLVDGTQRTRSFVVVTPATIKYPICIYAQPGGRYSAVQMRCTHRGCELIPFQTHLECPCHGSEFTSHGIVQSPPAELNLTSYTVLVEHDHLSISL